MAGGLRWWSWGGRRTSGSVQATVSAVNHDTHSPAPSPLSVRLRRSLKGVIAKAMKPGVMPLANRLDRLEARLGQLDRDARKYRGELDYWRWLILQGGSEKEHGESYEAVFGRWQRHRLLHLGSWLGLEGVRADGTAGIDDWAAERSVIEIGAGPYPSIAQTRRGWKRAVAVDPLARGYVEEGLLPKSPICDDVVYIEAPGESIPLAGNFADLVIIENCLDHVSDPASVCAEILRLLKPGGMIWFFVDFSDHADHMHPHPMNEARVRELLRDFQMVAEEFTPHKAHPMAWGAYRGLWRKPVMGAVGAGPLARTPAAGVPARHAGNGNGVAEVKVVVGERNGVLSR